MKQRLGTLNALYPSLTVLAGSVVLGKENFNTIAHVGIMNHGRGACISLSMAKVHYTNQGIHEHRTFSVNIPDRSMVEVTDYCGLVSGRNTDKSQLFETFYGGTKNAPLIRQCPVNMECVLREVVDFPSHDLFIGEIVQTHANTDVLTEGKIDMHKLDPLLFDMSSKQYFAVGDVVADCWGAGKAFTVKEKENV